jgi:threonine dehydratase
VELATTRSESAVRVLDGGLTVTTHPVTLSDIRDAATRIAPWIHRTPVLTCAAIDACAERRVFLKCENLQKVGAFKIRGATNAVLRLSDEVAPRGVVTHSSGNHAQALALAARNRGIPAHVVMPTNAPRVKRIATEGYGAVIHSCEPNQAAREAGAAEVVAATGATLVPPFDHLDVIAGQGTVALELLEQVDDLDAVVMPVGGGGLMAGMTIALRALAPRVKIFAAEPLGADDAARSKRGGTRLPQLAPDTIADGLRTGVGELTWPVLRDLVDDVITVTDLEIVGAMRALWERAKLVVEPSGAVSLAAALGDVMRAHTELPRVAVVLSGGNVDLGAALALFTGER